MCSNAGQKKAGDVPHEGLKVRGGGSGVLGFWVRGSGSGGCLGFRCSGFRCSGFYLGSGFRSCPHLARISVPKS